MFDSFGADLPLFTKIFIAACPFFWVASIFVSLLSILLGFKSKFANSIPLVISAVNIGVALACIPAALVAIYLPMFFAGGT